MSKTTDVVRRTQSRRTLIYGAILVAVMLLFILLSYFMNKRNDNEAQAMLRDNNATSQSRINELSDENAQLRDDIQAYQAQIDSLQRQLDSERQKIDELQEEYRQELEELQAQYRALRQQYEEEVLALQDVV